MEINEDKSQIKFVVVLLEVLFQLIFWQNITQQSNP